MVPTCQSPLSSDLQHRGHRKYILGGRDETGQHLQQDSSTLVRDTVAKTPGAISYVAVSVLASTNAVHPIAIDGVKPTLDAISSGHYTFWAYEHMYTMGDENPLYSAFLDFMLTGEVQQQAQTLGYIPINTMKLPGLSATATTTPVALESEVTRRVIV